MTRLLDVLDPPQEGRTRHSQPNLLSDLSCDGAEWRFARFDTSTRKRQVLIAVVAS